MFNCQRNILRHSNTKYASLYTRSGPKKDVPDLDPDSVNVFAITCILFIVFSSNILASIYTRVPVLARFVMIGSLLKDFDLFLNL